jgi:hypothetical protein
MLASLAAIPPLPTPGNPNPVATTAPAASQTIGETGMTANGIVETIAISIGITLVSSMIAGWIQDSFAAPAKTGRQKNPISAGEAPSMHVQSLLFPKKRFSTRDAQAWARRHGYRFGKVDVTDRYIRLRQQAPGKTRTKRTIPFGHTGIKAVVGK